MGKSLPKPKKSCKVCKSTDMSESPTHIMGGSKFCSLKCHQEHTWKNTMKAVSGRSSTVKIPIVSNTASPNVKVIKDVPDRDKKYLEFVASFGCAVCNKESVAHHVYEGGMGTKCSDYWTINLCDGHHTLGTDSIHRVGNNTFEHTHCISIDDQMRKLMRQYILKLRGIE